MKTILQSLIFSFIFLGVALPLDIFAEGPKCTRETLKKFRKDTFNKLMSEKKYGEAADAMNDYLHQNNCWDSLIGVMGSAIRESQDLGDDLKKDAEEYLWATSDLTLAYLKSNQPGRCIEIARTESNQYFFNPLKEVNSDKLSNAFSTNEGLCEKKRKEMFPKVTTEKCSDSLLPKEIGYPLPQSTDKFPVKSVTTSIKMPKESGFECVVRLELEIMKGLVDGLCDSKQSCKESEEPEDASIVVIEEIYGITPGEPVVLQRIQYAEDSWCGDPEISLHKDSLKGENAPANILHIVTGLSACGGGTGRAETDSYYALTDGKVEPRDVCTPAYH